MGQTKWFSTTYNTTSTATTYKVHFVNNEWSNWLEHPTKEGGDTATMDTQKAKGIATLSMVAQKLRIGDLHVSEYRFWRADELLTLLDESNSASYYQVQSALFDAYGWGGTLFVRPCPTRPRHGFVESRAVPRSDWFDQLKKIAKEAIAADPDAEIIVMPYIDKAPASAIITSANITVGAGNDGATSGKGAVTLPLATPRLKDTLGQEILAAASIGSDEDVYLELVNRRDHGYDLWSLVQLRAGPQLNGSVDFVPDEVTVKKVVVPKGTDLLEWESKVGSLPPGTVVYHEGGSLASHYGVHCVINKVPYLTSAKPKKGQVLAPTKGEAWGEEEYSRLALAIGAYEPMSLPGDPYKTSDQRAGLRLVLGGLHGLGSLMQSNSNESIRAAALAVSFGMRYFAALCIGEARHAEGGNTIGDVHRAHDLLNGYGADLPYSSEERAQVYADALDAAVSSYDKLARQTVAAMITFEQPGWAKSYGGKKWLVIARGTLRFYEDVRHFVLAPTEGNAQAMLNTFNRIVNLAHNGGFWLNKLIDQSAANRLAATPVFGFCYEHLPYLLRHPLKKRSNNIPPMKALVKEFRDHVAMSLSGMMPSFLGLSSTTVPHHPYTIRFKPGGKDTQEYVANIVREGYSVEVRAKKGKNLYRLLHSLGKNIKAGDDGYVEINYGSKDSYKVLGFYLPTRIRLKTLNQAVWGDVPSHPGAMWREYPELVTAILDLEGMAYGEERQEEHATEVSVGTSTSEVADNNDAIGTEAALSH